MILLLITFAVFHALFFTSIFVIWKSIGEQVVEGKFSAEVSVIVPFRNESKNLPDLFESLESQKIGSLKVEIILVNDHSEDDSMQLCKHYEEKSRFNVRTISLPVEKSGKKAASTKGVLEAQYSVILCTDADCKFSTDWIYTMTGFLKNHKLDMVTGPVRMNVNNWFEKLQACEFAGLIAYGASSLQLGIPGMCNGANMGYLREKFLEVDGYAGNDHIASGDDEFLLQKISNLREGSVGFCKNNKAIVQTSAKKNIKKLINQRIRWTSKWKLHKSIFIKLSAVLVFLDAILGLLVLYFITQFPIYCVLIISIRWLSEFLYLKDTTRYFGIKSGFVDLVAISIIYPFYVLFLGIASIFGAYNWKGRTYR